ncbi:MAG TPA: sigma 54-interacting transcriptional regulator [Desulfosalsimonadaceae bacterium]|nr:sigma 54-interacting transcriptional regulator [Desulfosalsimonadaceae bacterium]
MRISPVWNKQFAERLLDSMAEGVFTLDSQGYITTWNPAMERMTGYTAAEAIGQSCRMLKFSKCFDQNCPSSMRECGILEKGAVDPTECHLEHRDGHMVSVIKNVRVVKDENNQLLGVVETITDLTELNQVRMKFEEAQRKLAETYQFGNIIGKSHAMQEVFNSISMAAKSNATVLIHGESGTGKELVASAIHYNSAREKGPMLTVNCSALSESLLESELFGHVRGAFTGATHDRIGRFEQAHTGTVFLDEIGDISTYIQLKLLRTIQEKQVERVGEAAKREIDFRIIAATHKDLASLVRQGRFREDLYYRLKVFPITLPPLRRRREDIPFLANHFVDEFNKKTGKSIQGLSTDAMRLLMEYHWPGNVRELENAIEHAFVLCRDGQIGIFDLPVEIRQIEYFSPAQPAEKPGAPARPAKVTKDTLMQLLRDCGWNKAEVARRLGRSRTSVWQYMKKWGIPLDGARQ